MKKLMALVLLGVLLTGALAQETDEALGTTGTDTTLPPVDTGGTTTTSDSGETTEPTTIAEEIPTDLESIDDTAPEPTEPVEITETTTVEEVVQEVTGEVIDPEIVVEQSVPVAEQVSCQAGRYVFATEHAVVRMNAVIDYVKAELGADASGLEAIKNEFYGSIVAAQSATMKEDLEKLIVDSKALVTQFREMSNAISGFNRTKAQEYMDGALAQNEGYLSQIEAERNQQCAATVMTRFDASINNAAKVLKEMDEAGVNPQAIESLKYQLGLLIQMRSELQTALEAGDMVRFRAVEQAFLGMSRELKLKGTAARVVARENFGSLVSRLAVYRNIARQAGQRLGRLTDSGVEIEELNATLAEVNGLLDQAEDALRLAKQKWNDDDFSGAKDATDEAKSLLEQARQAYEGLRLDAGKGLLQSVCKDFDAVMARAESAVATAEAELAGVNGQAQEPAANMNRVKTMLAKAKQLKQSGKLDDACELIQEAQKVHTRLKEEIADRSKVKAGERLVSDEALSAGNAAAIMRAAQQPQVVKDFCERKPEECARVLNENPMLVRIVRERAQEVVQQAIAAGRLNESAVGPVRSQVREEVREEFREQVREEVRERVDEILDVLEERGLRVEACRDDVLEAIDAGVTDREELVSVCRRAIIAAAQAGQSEDTTSSTSSNGSIAGAPNTTTSGSGSGSVAGAGGR